MKVPSKEAHLLILLPLADEGFPISLVVLPGVARNPIVVVSLYLTTQCSLLITLGLSSKEDMTGIRLLQPLTTNVITQHTRILPARHVVVNGQSRHRRETLITET